MLYRLCAAQSHSLYRLCAATAAGSRAVTLSRPSSYPVAGSRAVPALARATPTTKGAAPSSQLGQIPLAGPGEPHDPEWIGVFGGAGGRRDGGGAGRRNGLACLGVRGWREGERRSVAPRKTREIGRQGGPKQREIGRQGAARYALRRRAGRGRAAGRGEGWTWRGGADGGVRGATTARHAAATSPAPKAAAARPRSATSAAQRRTRPA